LAHSICKSEFLLQQAVKFKNRRDFKSESFQKGAFGGVLALIRECPETLNSQPQVTFYKKTSSAFTCKHTDDSLILRGKSPSFFAKYKLPNYNRLLSGIKYKHLSTQALSTTKKIYGIKNSTTAF